MVSQRNKRFIATALVACGMTAAHADGLYVGGSLGAPNYSNSINGIGGGGGGDGTGLKLYGGDQLTPNFAVEGGLFSLGRTGGASVGRWMLRAILCKGGHGYHRGDERHGNHTKRQGMQAAGEDVQQGPRGREHGLPIAPVVLYCNPPIPHIDFNSARFQEISCRFSLSMALPIPRCA